MKKFANLSATLNGQDCLPVGVDQNWSELDSALVIDFPHRLLQIFLSTFKAILKFPVNTLESWQDESCIRCFFRVETPTSIET